MSLPANTSESARIKILSVNFSRPQRVRSDWNLSNFEKAWLTRGSVRDADCAATTARATESARALWSTVGGDNCERHLST